MERQRGDTGSALPRRASSSPRWKLAGHAEASDPTRSTPSLLIATAPCVLPVCGWQECSLRSSTVPVSVLIATSVLRCRSRGLGRVLPTCEWGLIVDDVPVVRRGELTDEAWVVIAPLLPESGGSRGRWRDHRQVINGILWKLCTGAPWRDLPERFGRGRPAMSACGGGTLTARGIGSWPRCRSMTTAQRCSGRSVSTRRSCGRTSMPLVPAKRGSATSPATPGARDGEAIGRSRGGLSTKIHLAVDGRGRPLSLLLTPGQAGDNPQLLTLLDAIRVNEPGPGRPRKRPEVLIADKGYALDSTRRALRQRGIRHVIPERSDQVRPPGSQGQHRRTTTSLRQGDLQEAQRRRTLLQPAQTVA
ncbi:IS5 family transposase [Micromonospora sp. NPDC023888]|uniref:IS5 family transposase n=1 Tax=Micromonospora sp. NPDC023888 TaxID=3155607 RepID=UPI0033D3ECF5